MAVEAEKDGSNAIGYTRDPKKLVVKPVPKVVCRFNLIPCPKFMATTERKGHNLPRDQPGKSAHDEPKRH